MANYILVKVDTNDADYALSFEPLDDSDLEKIKLMIEKIKANTNYHNFGHMFEYTNSEDEYGGYVSEENRDADIDAHDTFVHYCPRTEHGFHTVEKVEIYDVGHVTRLL